MHPLVILLFVVFIAIALVFGYLSHLAEKKRTERLQAYAQQRGWAFSPERDRSFDNRWSRFKCFHRGHSRYAHNRMRGALSINNEAGETVTADVELGDYHYKITSGSGKNRSTKTYRFSFVLIESPTPGGDLAVRAEHFGDKLAAGLGFDDIDFESVEFSDRFHVKAADKRFAYDVLHPRMMEYLLGTATPDFEIRAGVLCVTGGRSRWDAPEFDRRLHWIDGFFALWPRHLIST